MIMDMDWICYFFLSFTVYLNQSYGPPTKIIVKYMVKKAAIIKCVQALVQEGGTSHNCFLSVDSGHIDRFPLFLPT